MVHGDAIYHALLDAATDAIVAVDQAGRIVLVNRQTQRLFGYEPDELVGQPVELIVPDLVVGEVRPVDPADRALAGDRARAGRRKDGSEFPAEVNLSAIETEDGVLVSAAIRDVTDRIEAHDERARIFAAQAERERLESLLGRSQRLESLGQLAGGVAHDFNNLLAVILNYTSFVAEEVSVEAEHGDERWVRVRTDVEQIQRAGRRAAQLTNQLQAFARRAVVHADVVNLNDVVGEVRTFLDRVVGPHVQLEIVLASDLLPVLADPARMEQVLMNLAVNARDAMPGGGRLTISTATRVIDDHFAESRPGLEAGTYVLLHVSDTGTGMDPEVVKRAFEPFFTTKRPGEGSGLGLATAYGIVSQAAGYMEIASEPDVGTTITTFLPATDRSPETLEPVARREPSHTSRTVLVVEDEDAMREVTRRILERSGHRVLTAASGPDAIALARHYAGRIDLVLTDVIMPEMLGREVAEQLSTIRPGIRVLFMSGYAGPVLGSDGSLAPGVVLVEKPFSEETLIDTVWEVLSASDPPAPAP